MLQAHQQYVSLRNPSTRASPPSSTLPTRTATTRRSCSPPPRPATPRRATRRHRVVRRRLRRGPDPARSGNDAGGEIELDVRQEAWPRRRGAGGDAAAVGDAAGRGGYAANNGGRPTPPRATTPPGAAAPKPFMKRRAPTRRAPAARTAAWRRRRPPPAAPAATTPPRSTTPPGRKGPCPGKINAKMAAVEDDDWACTRSPRSASARQARRGAAAVRHRDGKARGGGHGVTGGGPTTRSPRKRPLGINWKMASCCRIPRWGG